MHFNAPLDSAGEGMGRLGTGLSSHHAAEGTRRRGWASPPLPTAGPGLEPWHQRGYLSLAARRERHGDLSLMSKLGVLMVN